MIINSAATAAEFCSAWVREGSLTAARRYITVAVDGLRRVLAIETTYKHNAEGTRAAIGMLESRLAEVARMSTARLQ